MTVVRLVQVVQKPKDFPDVLYYNKSMAEGYKRDYCKVNSLSNRVRI